jgi:hypothetical protein
MPTIENGIDRRSQLLGLIAALGTLVQLLEQDSHCQWTGHFAGCLSRAETLRDDGFDQGALNLLSASLRSVYGGMGSFNDYVPARVDRETGQVALIWGMEAFERAASAVYDASMELVVIGRY